MKPFLASAAAVALLLLAAPAFAQSQRQPGPYGDRSLNTPYAGTQSPSQAGTQTQGRRGPTDMPEYAEPKKPGELSARVVIPSDNVADQLNRDQLQALQQQAR